MTDSFTELWLALALFLASHSIPAVPAIRRSLVARMGEPVYLIGYSLLSLAILAWLIIAALRAPYLELWPVTLWSRWVPVLTMPLVCLLLVAGVSSANPLSFGALPRHFDPARPGIVAITRHPVLWAVTLWAAAHLPPNGHVAAVLAFGLFSGFGLMGNAIVDGKIRRHLGAETWQRLATGTSAVPFVALWRKQAHFRWRDIGVWRLGAALALYALVLILHESLFGVSPLPL